MKKLYLMKCLKYLQIQVDFDNLIFIFKIKVRYETVM